MPYADLLAIYNAIAEKPVTRFDTRANGVRRTEALLEMRGLTVAKAARLADVVLTDANIVQEEGPAADAAGQNTLQRRRKAKKSTRAGTHRKPRGPRDCPRRIECRMHDTCRVHFLELLTPFR
jgi:hypothetical protein